jgi:hypothetical protein
MTNKALLFGDIHWKKVDKYNLNPDKARCLAKVLDEWQDKVKYIFHMGDGSDKPVITSAVGKECEILSGLGENLSRLYYLRGNHDLSFGKYSPMSGFHIGTNINLKGMTEIGNNALTLDDTFVCRGYSKEAVPAVDGYRFYCGHQKINYSGGRYIGSGGIGSGAMKELGYEQMFFGDVHEPISDENIHSVGTMFPSSFSDEDYDPGFMILEWDDNESEVHRIKISDYPKFIIIEIDKNSIIPPELVKGNIIKIRLIGDEEFGSSNSIAKIRDHVMDLGARDVPIIKPPDIAISDLSRINQNKSSDIKQMTTEELLYHSTTKNKWPEPYVKKLIKDLSDVNPN